jgi:pyruvate dehydrogenase E1 component alpha subunit
MALDHRGTPPLLMRGIDPVALLRELLGRPDGLCRGMGGHMHLFAPDLLAASSGIVGASGPAAVGFALAGKRLRPGSVAVAFFGEGAMNQGMLLESLNLAAAWKLPCLFVCKDDGWAITTRSEGVTGGGLAERAETFGLHAETVDGWEVERVWEAAGGAVERARGGGGPSFLHTRCLHLEGHFLGDPLLRIVRRPISELAEISGPLLRSIGRRAGGGLGDRMRGLGSILATVAAQYRKQLGDDHDPLAVARRGLRSDDGGADARLEEVEASAVAEVERILRTALGGDGGETEPAP